MGFQWKTAQKEIRNRKHGLDIDCINPHQMGGGAQFPPPDSETLGGESKNFDPQDLNTWGGGIMAGLLRRLISTQTCVGHGGSPSVGQLGTTSPQDQWQWSKSECQAVGYPYVLCPTAQPILCDDFQLVY